MMAAKGAPPKYSQVLCIGTGLSGVCLGVQLKRKLGFEDVHFYERNPSHSGTWWSNHYPGAACDVPAIFYSFSFEQNPGWSKLLPSYEEIRRYVDDVVEKYGLRPRMTFRTECESAQWDSARHRWTVHLLDLDSGERFVHECQILFSAVGLLVDPKKLDVKGIESFEGPVFHTAKWRDDVDLKDKNVIVVGNGCTGSQLVPNIVSETKTLTQFINSPHWLLNVDNPDFSPAVRFALRRIPLLGRLLRFSIFIWAENWWRLFVMNNSGARLRRSIEKQSRDFILSTGPKKYHDILIPEFQIACKRRIFDANAAYLKSLHEPNMHLTKDKLIEVLPTAVRTAKDTYPADVIVLANGFKTNNGLGPLRIRGRDGKWLNDHWEQVGGASAYNSTSVAGFPNFFMLYGPNSNTGHTSVIMTTEFSVTYALQVIKPLLRGEALEVEVKAEAEESYTTRVQAASKTRVFNTCVNWYMDEKGWNGTTYPWSQLYFWWRSAFPVWNDWEYKYTARHWRRRNIRRMIIMILFTLGLIGAIASWSGIPWVEAVKNILLAYFEKIRSLIGVWVAMT